MRRAAYLIAAGLFLAGCSQIVIVPRAPDGSTTEVDVTWEQGRERFDRPGYALYIDRLQDIVYRLDEEESERLFGPTLEPMRAILAAGLPELRHSCAVLLEHAEGPLGYLILEIGGRPAVELTRAGDSLPIDGYPGQAKRIDRARLDADFGPALEALANTVKARRSYIVLLESPDGAASKVVYRTRDTEVLLEQPGRSLTLDGIDHEAESTLAERDFSPARAETRAILDAGLPPLAHSYAALPPHPGGPLGSLEILEGAAGGTRLDQAWQAVIIDGYSETVYRLDEAQYQRDFGAAIAATPPAPITLLLYFESGGARLARKSKATATALLDAIRAHPAADISIAGHADTVGSDGVNEQISRRRGELVAEMIRASGAPYQEISLSAYGKTQLAVETPDNTPELLNRRVEITVR